MREIKFRAWDKARKKMIYKFIIAPTSPGWGGFIFMQYTGLRDKNGKEIYEGDVVKHSCGAYGVITWINHTPTESEIIGNIYENPELIKH